MTIETKFNINDLVQYKYQRTSLEKKSAVAFEVIEITAINCYTTAQVYYTCRPVHILTDYDFEKKERKIKDVVSGITPEGGEYCKFREDELKPCDEQTIAIIKNV